MMRRLDGRRVRLCRRSRTGGSAAAQPPAQDTDAAGPGARDGMRMAVYPDDLALADVTAVWWRYARQASAALRNFAAARFIRVPAGAGLERMAEARLRAAVNDVGARRGLPKADRLRVYEAAVIAFARLPLGMSLPSPLGILREVDTIVDGAPELADAVLAVWGIIDDPAFWSRACDRT